VKAVRTETGLCFSIAKSGNKVYGKGRVSIVSGKMGRMPTKWGSWERSPKYQNIDLGRFLKGENKRFRFSGKKRGALGGKRGRSQLRGKDTNSLGSTLTQYRSYPPQQRVEEKEGRSCTAAV